MLKIRQPIWYASTFSEMALDGALRNSSLGRYCVEYGVEHTLSVKGLPEAHRLLSNLEYVGQMFHEDRSILPMLRRVRLFGLSEWCTFVCNEVVERNSDLPLKSVMRLCAFMRLAQVVSLSCVRLHAYVLEKLRQGDSSSRDVLQYTMHLGSQYMANGGQVAGYLDKAEELFLQTIKQYSSEQHTDPLISSLILEVRNELSVLYFRRGYVEQAYEMSVDLLADYVDSLGPKAEKTLQVKRNVAYLERERGDLDRAKELYASLYLDMHETLGNNHHTVLDFMNDYLLFLRSIGELEEGQLLEHLDFVQLSFGSHQPSYTRLYSLLGLWYMENGKLTQAETVMRDWIQLASLFERHTGHYNLGLCLAKQERYDEAQVEMETYLRLSKEHHHVSAESWATGCYNIAHFFCDKPTPDFHRALELFHESLDNYKIAYGVERPIIRNLMWEIIDVYKATEQIDGAITMLLQYLEALKPHDVPEIQVSVQAKVGILYTDLSDFQNAKRWLLLALDYVDEHGEVKHARKRILCWYLQKCAYAQGDIEQMFDWLETAARLQRETKNGFCSPNGFLMNTTLCERYCEFDRLADAKRLYRQIVEAEGINVYMSDAQRQRLQTVKDQFD